LKELNYDDNTDFNKANVINDSEIKVSIQFEDRADYKFYNFKRNKYNGSPKSFIEELIHGNINPKVPVLLSDPTVTIEAGGKKRKTQKNRRKNKIF